MDSSKAAAVVWLLGAKVRSQPGPKGAIHGIGASPSGLLGIACKTCNSYNWVGDIPAKENRKKLLMVQKFPQKPRKVSIFERLKSG